MFSYALVGQLPLLPEVVSQPEVFRYPPAVEEY